MEYKVGDRVIIERSIIDEYGSFAGKHGVIKDIMVTGEFDYFVQLDDDPFMAVWSDVKSEEG